MFNLISKKACYLAVMNGSPGTKMQQLAVNSISLHCYYRVDISLGRRVLIRDDRRLAAIGSPDIPHPSSHGQSY